MNSASCLRGLPELAGDAHAEGIARVIGLPDGRCQRRDLDGGKGDHESVCGGPRLLRVGGDRGDCSGSHRYRAADRKVARYAHRRRGRRGRRGQGRGGRAPLDGHGHGDGTARGTLGSDPKSATEPAGHWPAGVAGWLRMTCMMIGDPRSRAGGRLTGAGSGPSGVMLLQRRGEHRPAAASMRPAAARALARTDSGRAGRWKGMSRVLPRQSWRGDMAAVRALLSGRGRRRGRPARRRPPR